MQPTAIEQLAEDAIDAGEAIYARGVMALPDVAIVEGLANGLPALPSTFALVREDGRTVYFYTV